MALVTRIMKGSHSTHANANERPIMAKQIYAPENIAELTIGRVVRHPANGLYGHILGFKMNVTDEVIIEVKWCNGDQYTIHSNNVELL